MKKLNSVIYNKLLAQADEAKYRKLPKLAAGILGSLGPVPEDENVKYNFSELQNDVYQELWKVATCVIKYHDLKTVDAERVHQVLDSFASKIIEDIEQSLDVKNDAIGPLEDKVLGEK